MTPRNTSRICFSLVVAHVCAFLMERRPPGRQKAGLACHAVASQRRRETGAPFKIEERANMRYYKRITPFAELTVSAIVFLIALSTFAAGEVEVSINPQPLMLGETAQLQVRSSEDYPKILELPKIDGISWGSDVSRSMQSTIINMKKSSSYISIYEITPQKEGDLEIPALKIQYGKKKTVTDPVKTKVIARKYSVTSTDNKSSTKKELGLDDLLYLKFSFFSDRKKFYVGEEILFEIKVYGARELPFKVTSWPDVRIENAAFRDFSAVNPENPHFLPCQTSTEKVNGQIFNVYAFRSALRPIAPGKLSGKMDIACVLRIPSDRRSQRSSDPFEDFMSPFASYKSLEQKLSCEFPVLEVVSLPDPSGTVNYLGLIGDWKIKTELNQEYLKTGEPVTLKVSGAGDGTTDTLKAPEIKIEGFRTYPPEIKKDLTPGGNDFEIRYVLLPLQEGTAQLSFPVSYFSTSSGKYVEIAFNKKLKVEKSDNVAQSQIVADSGVSSLSVPSALEKKNGTKKINDILYLKKNLSGPVLLPLWKNHILLILFLLILGPAAWGFSEFHHRRKLRLEKDPVLRRKLDALARKGGLLREIRKTDPDKMHDLLQNDVVPYLNDLLGLPPGTSATELSTRIEDNELAELLKSGADSAYLPGASKKSGSDRRDSLVRSLKKLSLLLVLLALPFAASSDSNTDQSFNPMGAYNKGEFAKVADYYRKQIDMNSPDPALLYNLGNCLYQLSDPAKALVMYSRALHLSPRDSDIRENLNLVHRKLGVPEVGTIESPRDLLVFVRDMLRPDEWMLAAASVWAFAGIILAFRRKFASETGLYVLLSCTGIVFVILLIAPISQSTSSYSSKTAFAVIKNMQVYLLPAETSKQADFRINCGEKLFIEEERDSWLRVRTDNGSEGWIKADSAERLFK